MENADVIPFDMSDHYIIYCTIDSSKIEDIKIKFTGRSMKNFDADTLIDSFVNLNWESTIIKIQITYGNFI